MNEFQLAIISQTVAYITVLLIAFVILGFLLKGFLGPFLRVKKSFGKLILVRQKGVMRDSFRVGEIVDGMLDFKVKTGHKLIPISEDSRKAVYRAWNINCVDIDEEKNCILMPNYSMATGYDAEKYSDLYVRALYKPAILDNKEKILLVMLIIVIIICVGGIIFNYRVYKVVVEMRGIVGSLLSGGVKAA